MACADRTGALLRMADGELAAGDQRDLDRHVLACEDCRSTLEWMVAENQAIAMALSPTPLPNRRPLLGRLSAAAALLLLTGGALYGLLLFSDRVRTARDWSAVQAEADLEVPVTIRARDLPLDAFLADLSEVSGVDVTVSPAALARFPKIPRVSITLVSPITLRSILALLTEFHGLIPEVVGEGVILK